jgi:hypothetical protein
MDLLLSSSDEDEEACVNDPGFVASKKADTVEPHTNGNLLERDTNTEPRTPSNIEDWDDDVSKRPDASNQRPHKQQRIDSSQNTVHNTHISDATLARRLHEEEQHNSDGASLRLAKQLQAEFKNEALNAKQVSRRDRGACGSRGSDRSHVYSPRTDNQRTTEVGQYWKTNIICEFPKNWRGKSLHDGQVSSLLIECPVNSLLTTARYQYTQSFACSSIHRRYY